MFFTVLLLMMCFQFLQFYFVCCLLSIRSCLQLLIVGHGIGLRKEEFNIMDMNFVMMYVFLVFLLFETSFSVNLLENMS